MGVLLKMLKNKENAQEILLSDTMCYKSLSMAADWFNTDVMSPMLYISVEMVRELWEKHWNST